MAPQQTAEWRERMAAAWNRAGLPMHACPECGYMADPDGRCLLRCDREPIRPTVTLAAIIGLAMLVR